MTEQPMCLVLINDDGTVNYTRTEGVRMFIVDENAPSDRVYEISTFSDPRLFAEIIGNGTIGRRGDGSPSEARLNAAIAKYEGRSHLAVVSGETLTEGEG